MATFIDGGEIGKEILKELAGEIKARIAAEKRAPHLVVVHIGANLENMAYVKRLNGAASYVKIHFTLKNFGRNVQQDTVIEAIQNFNNDGKVDGILVLCPALKKIKSTRLNSEIIERKDISGKNMYLPHLYNGKKVRCLHWNSTSMGVCEIMKRFKINLIGKKLLIAETALDITPQVVDALRPVVPTEKEEPAKEDEPIKREKPIESPAPAAETVEKDVPRRKQTTKIYIYDKSFDKGILKKYYPKMDVIVTNFDEPEVINTNKLKPGVIIIDAGVFKKTDPETKEVKKVGNVKVDISKFAVSQFIPTPGTFETISIAMTMRKVLNAAQMNDQALEVADPDAWAGTIFGPKKIYN